MRFLADMGVSGSTVRSLRALGHEATHLREEGLMRLPDPQILEKSREEGRILLTFDLGFGELLAASRQELPSTVIFRVRDATPSSVTQKLVAFLSAAGEELSRGAVVVIEDTRFHLRRLPLKKAKSQGRSPSISGKEAYSVTCSRRKIHGVLVFFAVQMSTTSPRITLGAEPAAAEEARQFVAAHEKVVRPLEKALSVTWWNANVTGKDEDFQAKEEAQNRLDAVLSDARRFADLEKVRGALAGAPQKVDPILTRQIDLLHLQYLEKQVDPAILKKISAKANAIEKAFNAYRANVGGKELTDSEVRKTLKESRDPKLRRAVWEASKAVGPIVAADLRDLVLLRNEAARKLGFKDYHAMQLEINEQSQQEVLRLFDELEVLTKDAFRKAKAEIDSKLAAMYGIPEADLRPWHYHDPFFQEAPAIYEADVDSAYAKADILDLCRKFYAGIGLPVDDVLARSDLYEKPGKSPHAFCTDIDREGDVRVLANIVPNEYWMGTMLHELGHAVYSSKNIPPTVPYVLRTEAHILATEGIAILFERFSKSADWLSKMGVSVPDPAAFNEAGSRLRKNHLLIFSAWCQVMLRFEKEMYANPDQDLNKLWWDLVEKYQMVRRPEGRSAPDYASKIHVVSAPAYYHNYLMGQLFACQLHHAMAREVLRADPDKALYNDSKGVGRFLEEKVFAPGRSLRWDVLTRRATGEALSPKAFASDFK